MADCENCGEVLHRVIKGKLSGKRDIVFQGVVKCQTCGRISDVTIRESKPVNIPVIVSWMGESRRIAAEIGPDVLLSVGEQLALAPGKADITAIESEGRRVMESYARHIETIWAKRADMVRVKVTLLKYGRGQSKEMFVAPEREFCIGDPIEIGRDKAVVQQIKLSQRTLRRGCAPASQIRRMYARSGGSRETNSPSAGRGRRQPPRRRRPTTAGQRPEADRGLAPR